MAALDELRLAAEKGDIDLLYTALKNKTSIFLEGTNSEELLVETPLHIAASKGHIPFAIEIMNWNPSFAFKLNLEGLSPIHIAIQNKNLRMVLCLVDMNKDLVRVKGKGGWTPLHLASQIGDVDILAELIRACPDSLTDVTVWGETALHIAARNDKYEALHLLVYFLMENTEKGASMLEYRLLKQKDEHDNTILHISVKNNYSKEMIQLLAKTNINLNAKNSEKKTALDMAVMAAREDIKSILLKAGAKPASAVTHSQTLAGKLKIPLLHKGFIYIYRVNSDISERTRETFLIIMTLTVTTTYQSVLSPPSGFYQANASDNNLNITSSNSTISSLGNTGKSVMSRDNFVLFSNFNMISFLISIVTIVVLMPRGRLGIISVLLPLYFLSASYIYSMNMISPGSTTNYQNYIVIIVALPTFLLGFFILKLYSKFQQLLIAKKLNR